MRKTILIVEDDSRIRRIFTRLLVSEGYRVIAVVNAVSGYEVVKKNRVDLVLLDIKMPQVKGDVLFDAMQLFYGGIKVIVSSVYTLLEQKKLISGAFDYHDKSQGVDILLGKIERALKD
ncbi:MAG: response regulator [Candidatus Omnitrophica bacterium]|nr:response regulator [Candidatus Omnitrophota bacterium]